MRRLVAALVLVAAAGWAAGADEKEARRLEGTYEVLEAATGGKPEPKAAEVKAFLIKDGKISIKTDKRDETAAFTVDPSKKPAAIDIMPGGDETVKGIYQTKDTDKGLELTIAFAKGPNSPRPKDFKGEGEVTVIKLLRKKDK